MSQQYPPVVPLTDAPVDVATPEIRHEGVIPDGVERIPLLVGSVSTLMQLLGKSVSPTLLVGGMAGAPREATLAACLRAAKRWGLDARIVQRTHLTDISSLTLPCILLLHGDRSCVLIRRTYAADGEENGASAEVIFPEEGKHQKTVPLDALETEYAGHAVFAALDGPLDARTKNVGLRRFKHWFWDVIAHYLPLYKHVILATVIINVAAVATSLFAMNVYDRVIPNHAVETLWVLAVGVGFAYVVDFILRNVRGYFVDMAGRNADVVLSSLLMRKVLGLRLDSKPESTGALVNNLREFEALREFFSSSSLTVLVDLPFLVLFLFLIFLIGGPLAFVPLAAVPFMLVLGLIFQALSQRNTEQFYRQNMQKNALLVEFLTGLENIKASMAENRLLALWEQLADASAESGRISKRYSTLASSTANVLSQMVSVAVIVWGVYLITDGSLSMGGLIACNILAGRAMAPLMQLAGMVSKVQQSRMALNTLNTIMALPSESDPDREHVDFGLLQPGFTFENVTFAYPNSERPSLDELSLTIRPREKVGIIGSMGSGKSTVGRLMAGFYAPQSGTVRFGGVDIRQMEPSDLRVRMGILPQDVTLFYGTIRDNIALGDHGVEDRFIMRAAYLAGASDFIRVHPDGFGAQVGERGANLSGGQRQTVALARALIHNPEVLILDEPTSQVDKMTEAAIKHRLAKVIADKTLIIITHRPALLELVDRVIVLEKGKVVADGPRDAVLQSINPAAPIASQTVDQAVAAPKAAAPQ